MCQSTTRITCSAITYLEKLTAIRPDGLLLDFSLGLYSTSSVFRCACFAALCSIGDLCSFLVILTRRFQNTPFYTTWPTTVLQYTSIKCQETLHTGRNSWRDSNVPSPNTRRGHFNVHRCPHRVTHGSISCQAIF